MKIMVAMSGGLDSSMVAALLKEQGHELVGVTMRVWKTKSAGNIYDSFDDEVNDARNIAAKFDFPHYLIDVQDDFLQIVIDDFKEGYLAGKTPNPCVICNRHIKFGKLIEIMQELGCEKIATGHYAQISHENERYFLQKGLDAEKDQTYFMWNIQQKSLSKIMFPLGEYSKKEIREMATERGLFRVATKRESYNLCFLPDDDYRSFLQTTTTIPRGNFVLEDGTIVGEHKGYPHYTIGQRKGLDIAHAYPLYVLKLDTERHEIVLGKKEKLYVKEFYLQNCNFHKYKEVLKELEVLVKIRHGNTLISGKLINEDKNYKIELYEVIFAIASGQSAVFYENNDLIGGGFIK